QLSGGLSSLPDVLSRAKSGRRLGARDRFRCRTAGVMLEDARTRDIFAANLSARHKPPLGAGRPRGGVVTQRTANPRTPVRFRPWPPILSSAPPERFTLRFTNRVHDLALSSLAIAAIASFGVRA